MSDSAEQVPYPSLGPTPREDIEGRVDFGVLIGRGHMTPYAVVDNPSLFETADVVRQGDNLLVSAAISNKPASDEFGKTVETPQSKAMHDFVAAEEEAKIQADLRRGQVVVQTVLPTALWKRNDRSHKNVVTTMIRHSSVPFAEKPDIPEAQIA